MGKISFFFASLVAAVPAGYLAYEMASTFLTRADKMAGVLTIIAGLTLAVSAVVTLIPVAILLFVPSAEKPAKASEDAAAADDGDESLEAEDEDVVAEDDELEAFDDEDEFEIGDDDEWDER